MASQNEAGDWERRGDGWRKIYKEKPLENSGGLVLNEKGKVRSCGWEDEMGMLGRSEEGTG